MKSDNYTPLGNSNISTGSIQPIEKLGKNESKMFWFNLKNIECSITINDNHLMITARNKKK